MIKLEYKELCPNCGGTADSLRLEEGLPCEACLPQIPGEMREGAMSKIFSLNERLMEIEDIFQRALKTKMWALQRFWAKRFLEGESFALVAPTGSGKTTMQILLSLYASSKMGKRCLLILPTSILAHQVSERMIGIKRELNLDVEVAHYHSLLSKREKTEQLKKMGRASIIVTTHLSIMKRPEINSQTIDIAFVDDVDSFLKRGKSAMFVLRMLNLPNDIKEVINNAYCGRIGMKEALENIKRLIGSEVRGQIIVSGATPRGKRTKSALILNNLFGFTVEGRIEFGRRVLDSYIKQRGPLEGNVLEIIRRIGGGALVFVPSDKGRDFAEKLEKYLKGEGIKARAFLKPSKRHFEMFERGEIECLIGMATLRSPLVRGIDLPHRIRYAIFAGVPKFLIRINIREFHPSKWLMLLNSISQAIGEERRNEFESIVKSLAKIRTLNAEQLKAVREALREDRKLEGFLEYARNAALEAAEFFGKILKDENIIRALKEAPTLSFGVEENEYYFLVVDEVAYIQASGRTSRLYIGGLTQGLSIVVIDDEKAFNGLRKELEYIGEEIEWKNFEEIDLDPIIKRIDEDRKKVILSLEGKLEVGEGISISTMLFVVESPNKARTIARYFGRPFKKIVSGLRTYEVFLENSLAIITASKGHITDLDLRDGLFGVRVDGGFVPIYRPIRRCAHCGREIEDEGVCPFCEREDFVDSKPRIEALRRLASLVDGVVIGTDPDAEGEKIAFDLYLLLKPFNKNIKRARFREVTKREIIKSLNNLEDLDLNLVEAQIVRRIEDRWIGFSISPILWKAFGNRGLSAGRVQTPVLGWIDERTKKLGEKEELINIALENGLMISFRDEVGASKGILENEVAEVLEVEKRVEEVNPHPPFTTDTLISALTSSLRIDANQAMMIAQRLFENGLITYHRTGSTTVSKTGIAIARDYISSNFGEEFVRERSWQMEGPHECIRPTKGIDLGKLRGMMALRSIKAILSEQELRAYDIIFRRFIASQMRSAKVEKTLIRISIAGKERDFEFTTKVVEEGFSKVIPIRVKEIPEVGKGKYRISSVKTRIVPAHHPLTYSEIVSMMRERGIGRPSTYAKILEVLKRRKYVNEVRKSMLFSTPLGSRVYSFLKERYEKYLNEERTKKLEEEMDKIERGELRGQDVIGKFYGEIVEIIKGAEREGVEYPLLSI